MAALSPELQAEIAAQVDRAVARAVARIAPREEYFTAKECAAVIKVHEDTVLRWARARKLRSVGRGRHLRIPHSAIVEFFAASPEPAIKAHVHG